MAEKTVFKIVAKYDGRCAECREPVEAGDDVYFDSADRRVYCESCGEHME